jgi:CelD/BcsL family acetyltransferase involved in cellulose biosynthesis
VQLEPADLPYPFQRFNYSEDLVVNLPPTAEEYHRRLGKNTRRNIKRYSERLQRGFPSVQFSVAEKEAVSRQDVRDIVRLNHERMAGKHKLSAIDDAETDRIIRLVEECGLVGVTRIDGRVVAGTIAYRVGANFFLNVLAHDPKYDEYWLGILCCYQTICECIARNGKDFHFLWGKYEYKYTLLAQQRDLDILHVYRSWPAMLSSLDMVLQAAVKGWLRRLSTSLHDAAHGPGPGSRWLVRLLAQVRMLKGG